MFHGHPSPWRYPEKRAHELDAAGRIYVPRNGGVPRLKRYLHEHPGIVPGSIWTDIPPVQSHAKERVGYSTQKPLVILDRIIKASSNPGDLVLEPFCGCATALVAAERLKRKWVGIDLSEKAVELVRMRCRQPRRPARCSTRCSTGRTFPGARTGGRSPTTVPTSTRSTGVRKGSAAAVAPCSRSGT